MSMEVIIDCTTIPRDWVVRGEGNIVMDVIHISLVLLRQRRTRTSTGEVKIYDVGSFLALIFVRAFEAASETDLEAESKRKEDLARSVKGPMHALSRFVRARSDGKCSCTKL